MTQTTSLTHTQSDRAAQKRRVLAALDALRLEARRQNPDLSAEAAYRLAGFSAEVVQDTLRADQELASPAL
jgi:hypothetical protein